MLEKDRRQQEKRKTVSNLRWMDSIKEALGMSPQEQRTGHCGHHSFIGSPGVRADSMACTKTSHAGQFLPLSESPNRSIMLSPFYRRGNLDSEKLSHSYATYVSSPVYTLEPMLLNTAVLPMVLKDRSESLEVMLSAIFNLKKGDIVKISNLCFRNICENKRQKLCSSVHPRLEQYTDIHCVIYSQCSFL